MKKPSAGHVLVLGVKGGWLEERHTEVGAGVDGQVDVPGDLLGLGRDGLGLADRAGLGRVADVELVVVRSKGLEVGGLKLCVGT